MMLAPDRNGQAIVPTLRLGGWQNPEQVTIWNAGTKHTFYPQSSQTNSCDHSLPAVQFVTQASQVCQFSLSQPLTLHTLYHITGE